MRNGRRRTIRPRRVGVQGAKNLRASLALAALCALLAACSSAPRQESADPATDTATTRAAVRTPAEVRSLDLTDDGAMASLELEADRPLVWTSFRDAEGDLVVELPNSQPMASLTDLMPASGLVTAVEVEQVNDSERPLTRLTVRTREPSEHSLVGDGDRLRLQLLPIDSAQEVTLAYEPVEAADEPVDMAAAPEPVVVEEIPLDAPNSDASGTQAPTAAEPRVAGLPRGVPQTYGTADSPQVGPSPTGVGASQLYAVDVLGQSPATTVQVSGDGEFAYSTFRLENPERFVVDLIGVINVASNSTVPIGSSIVDRVRIGQFKPRPEPVSRVVFDLSDRVLPTIYRTSDGLTITFGDDGAMAGTVVADVAAEPMAADPMVSEQMVSEQMATETSAPEVVAVVDATEWPADDSRLEEEVEETVLDEPMDEPVIEEITLDEPMDQNEAEMAQMAPQPAADSSRDVRPDPVPVYEPMPSAAPAADARVAQAPAYTPPAPTAQPRPARPAGDDVALFEAQQVVMTDEEVERERLLDSFGELVVNRQEREYVGAPLTMSVANADLVETLRSFAKISDLNFVIQPGVSGSVTVEFKEVPWDQAMEQILKINNLGMEIDGSIVRIAPRDILQQEADAARRLRQAREQTVPLRTVMRSLSYAQASSVAGLLRNTDGAIMSRRGSVQVDDRTNTLILRELPDFIDTVLAVIDNLDTPEPQVMIEARIIEANKNFSRSLGVQWGYDYEAQPESGNTTGLIFPNTVDTDGGVGLLTGGANGFLNLAMGNILDTFNLNLSLQAAEAEGLVNVVSAPRITTLNNTSASIQSGLQIPIQTVSDRTVSVQFVNATLNLTVRPQVTAEGTIVLDINVARRTPQLAFAIVGATNAPIATREARTRVVVRDGGTAVIGGIYQVTSNDNQDRVPGLSNIPILGYLFKNRNRSDSNEELMIFITPRIVQI